MARDILHTHTHTRENNVKMEAENGVIHKPRKARNANRHLKLEAARKDPPLESLQREHSPWQHLVSDFWLPEL